MIVQYLLIKACTLMLTKEPVKKIVAFDFDSTLIKTPVPEEGMALYKTRTGKDFPDKGWWSSPASLDIDVFDIKPYNDIVNILAKEASNPNTMVIILTSRIEELRPDLMKILNKNGIKVDGIFMNDHNIDKGERIFDFLRWERSIKAIDVYDDRDKDIASYFLIKKYMPVDIVFNIYRVNQGKAFLIKEAIDMVKIIQEEINNQKSI